MKLPPFTSSVDAYTKSFTSSSHSSIQLIDLPQVDLPSPDLLKLSFESYLTQYIENNMPQVRNIVTDLVSSHSDDESDSARVTGLVLDFFCVSMIDVANDFGLPSYIFLTTSTGFMSLMLYLSTRHEYDQTLTEFKPSDSDLSIPGFANPVPVSVLLSGLFNKVGYTNFVKIGQRFRDVNGILVNTFAELEPYAIDIFSGGLNPPVYTVGPLVDLKGQPIPDPEVAKRRDILKWLDDQPESSVVFLCFGSGGSFSPAQVKEIATGLEQKQQLNAFRMVKELGLAVELRLDSRMNNGDLVTADEISRAVGSVMVTDTEIRMKVKEVSEIGRKSLMDGGSSFISMGQFIDLNF
ncbi:hypothetical protein QYF36_008745 [Acer negundo]|nr:hypothetical protein QYF36_008745 [Acer negundo]